jgi:hypothetical protein
MPARRKYTTNGDRINWYVYVNSDAMRGFHFGEASSIPEADREIDQFLESLNSCDAAA